jgi:hypothetical protein
MKGKFFLVAPLAMALFSPSLATGQPKVGDVVWAQWKPNGWYRGKADKKCPTGLHIVFDDGDKADLPLSLMALDQAPKEAQVKVGSRVLGMWTDNRFYPGTVVKIGGGNYDVKFDDGESRSVGLDDLRLLAVKPAANQTAKAGDKVWAQLRPNDWHQGKAAKKCPLGLHVVFDDGDKADLPMELIARDQAPKKAQVKVGARVLAPWTDGRHYPGTVAKAGDGEYEVKFDDGESRSVGLEDLRLLNE